MVRGPRGDRFAEGDTVTWAARHGGIPFRMTSWVRSIDEPRSFVDEQVRGPFARFHHQHFFAPADDNPQHTLMIDVISYRAPFGPLGLLVERVVLDRHLRGLIRTRNEELAAALASGWGTAH